MNPRDWLLDIYQRPDGYRLLLGTFGNDLVKAAHRLASVKCMAASLGDVPTSRELFSAVQEISLRTGWTEPLPTRDDVARTALRSGLSVL